MNSHEVTTEERKAIMVVCGNCSEEEAEEAYVNSEEYKTSMQEWDDR